MQDLLPAIPAPPGANLPAEYEEKPSTYFIRRLAQLESLSPAQKKYLLALVAGLRVTESRAEVEVAQRMVDRLPVLPSRS